MNMSKALDRLREIEEAEARKRGLSVETFRRMLRKVEEYQESHRAMGLPEELLEILKEDLRQRKAPLHRTSGNRSRTWPRFLPSCGLPGCDSNVSAGGIH